MNRCSSWLASAVLAAGPGWPGGFLGAQEFSAEFDFEDPGHGYWENPPTDPFSALIPRIEDGSLSLDTSDETRYVAGLLEALDIPESSQLLVYSTTSLQLAFISLERPRAIYFNEDVYVGHVRGGRIEVISVDPRLGAIFTIFDIPRQPGRAVVVERSDRCMNCHANASTGRVPGVVMKSVLPGPNRGTIDTYRRDQLGHQVPLAERFGGWHVTGADGFASHRGDLVGQYVEGKIVTRPVSVGNLPDYLRTTSDILPHLVMEHQAAFTNRLTELVYRWRLVKARGAEAELNEGIVSFLKYALFAEEAALPSGGFEGHSDYKRDFAEAGKADPQGRSLRDLDLKTRLFRHRCSYMIDSRIFHGIPADLRRRILIRLRHALDVNRPDPHFSYLPPAEKTAIQEIVRATVADLPAGW